MSNILFYGNCQMTPICNTLNLDKTKYNQSIIECFSTEMLEQEFHEYVVNADVIIMTIIENNYRDKHYLSTTYVVYHAKKDCKLIILNNFYFSFYYFDIKIIHTLGETQPYHHLSIFDCYNNSKDIDYYINTYVNNEALKTTHELEILANTSFEELNKRYDIILLHKQLSPDKYIYSIPISQYIKNNYKKKLLFYTPNHPSKYLFHYVSEQILSILNFENTINYQVDTLNHTRCILYKCIQKMVYFDISKESPLLCEKKTIQDISQWYYELYKNRLIEL